MVSGSTIPQDSVEEGIQLNSIFKFKIHRALLRAEQAVTRLKMKDTGTPVKQSGTLVKDSRNSMRPSGRSYEVSGREHFANSLILANGAAPRRCQQVQRFT
jgi:hypothetical protein